MLLSFYFSLVHLNFYYKMCLRSVIVTFIRFCFSLLNTWISVARMFLSSMVVTLLIYFCVLVQLNFNYSITL